MTKADLSALRGERGTAMNTTIELGAYVRTDRFCTVTIDAIFADNEDAVKCGYTEPTYTKIDGWEIKGKSIDCYHMRFAAIRKGE